MGYSEPYSSLLSGVVTRLVDAAGPFTKAGQVQLWAQVALDEVAPNEELLRALSRSEPMVLVCDGGSRPEGTHSDGTDEVQVVKVWIAASAPTMAAMVTGDGDEYWGTGALKHWVFSRLADRSWSLAGWETLEWRGTEPVAIPGTGRAMLVATFETRRMQQL